jgi:hypothetical protein
MVLATLAQVASHDLRSKPLESVFADACVLAELLVVPNDGTKSIVGRGSDFRSLASLAQ